MTEECNTFYFYVQRTQYGIIQRQTENAQRLVAYYICLCVSILLPLL
jgi:hypothetical protein